MHAPSDRCLSKNLSTSSPFLAGLSGAILVILLVGMVNRAGAADSFTTHAGPFLKQHCLSCHGDQKQEGGIRLDRLDGVSWETRDVWTRIHERVAAREMPPPGRPEPPEPDRQRLLNWATVSQRALGVRGTRRLNRRELSAALRDFTGLNVEFSQGLPGDGTIGGFDTGADGLQEASDAVAQWLVVTRRAVEGIRFLEPAREGSYALDLRTVRDVRKAFDPWKNAGATVKIQGIGKPGLGLLLEPRAVGDREELSLSIPPPVGRQGILRLAVLVSVLKPYPNLPNPRLWVRIGGQDLDYREITAPAERPERLVYEVLLGDLAIQARGVTVALSNKVEVPYAIDGFENDDRSNPKNPVPGGTGLFRPFFDRKSLPLEKHPAPYVVLHHIAIEPDVILSWPPLTWHAKGVSSEEGEESVRRRLILALERAWRRPVGEAEQVPFHALYQKLRRDGGPHDDALRSAIQSILMSAGFRYLPTPAQDDPVLAQHALAARLSFLLTGEPPDQDLRRLAATGKLSDPAMLDSQVDRLLDDPRSEAFLRPFVRQWLEMDQPITIAQEHIQKQDFRFARYLKASMREETFGYVSRLFRENRPARELIQSDWTLMNDILARHYGYEGIEGGALRRVKLRESDPRGGGLLGHAGLQSMLCWMGDNWVIYRGAWVLRHILDQPPPPPPLEVPELNPADARHKGKTFRELLQLHQEDSRCAVCHRTIDPIGFAFQNLDLSGRWREVEYESYARGELDGRVSWVGVGKSRPVDAVGRMPRGESFKSFAEFKSIVVANYETDLVRGLLKNLMLYATGRRPGIDTMQEIVVILKDQRLRGYPLRDLLKAVVRSRSFQDLPAP